MSNVVDLPVGVRVSPLLEKVAEIARIGLARSMSSFFDGIDDALFELADRSRSDNDQQIYFESMRELRLARGGVERGFLDAIVDKIMVLPEPPKRADDRSTAQGSDSLSLVRNDDLEITVAIAGIVSKISGRFSLALAQLTRRLDALCPRHEIAERDNPLGPAVLCETFVTALEAVQLDIKVRIILLKLFERLVVEQLGPLYDDANRLLSEAGILRNLERMPLRPRGGPGVGRVGPTRPVQPSQGQPLGNHAGGQGGWPGSGQEYSGYGAGPAGGSAGPAGFYSGADANTLDVLAALGLAPNLLQPLRAHSYDPRIAGAVPGGLPGGALGEGLAGYHVYPTQDLIHAIASAQHEHASAGMDLEHVPPPLDLRPLLLSALTQARQGDARGEARLQGPDEDVVNLVGMLFDYILNDRNLAIPMKALLARLQLPYVKVALLDRKFFTQPSHPARQLLNELSSAGIGWSSSSDLKRDALYEVIESIVLRVLNRFERDLQLFHALLDELRVFRQQDDRRNKVVEQRIKDAEIGRSKAAAARRTVARVLEQKGQGLEVPLPVRDFVRGAWGKVLVYLCLRHGTDGREWQQAIASLDELLWAAQELTAHTEREERRRMLPRLLDALRDGTNLIGTDPSQVRPVAECLDARIAADDDAARGVTDITPPEVITLDLPAEAEAVVDDGPPPPADALAVVSRLRTETWVEFTPAGATPLRAKLAGILDDGNRFVFVNRKGIKVCERTRPQLAREFAATEVAVLEERQLFDRALERIIKNLRLREQDPLINADSVPKA